MRIVIQTVKVIYWIGVFISILMIGDIGRGGNSPLIWEGVATEYSRHGLGNACFAGVVYLILYSASFTIPFSILPHVFGALMQSEEVEAKNHANQAAFTVSVISFTTCNLFLRAVASASVAILTHLPQGYFAEWFMLGWLILTPAFLCIAFDEIKKEHQRQLDEARRQGFVDGEEQQMKNYQRHEEWLMEIRSEATT
jgi:hypothetical protein